MNAISTYPRIKSRELSFLAKLFSPRDTMAHFLMLSAWSYLPTYFSAGFLIYCVRVFICFLLKERSVRWWLFLPTLKILTISRLMVNLSSYPDDIMKNFYVEVLCQLTFKKRQFMRLTAISLRGFKIFMNVQHFSANFAGHQLSFKDFL